MYFIKYRYEGVTVEDAAKRVEISKPVAYNWQYRWNKEGYKLLRNITVEKFMKSLWEFMENRTKDLRDRLIVT